ncbi:MAG: hypothetical protein AB1631_02195 [Acidobacteriota bacterium]
MKTNAVLTLAAVFLISSAAFAQEPKVNIQDSDRSMVFDIEVMDLSPDTARELERTAKDRAGIDKLIAAGRLKPIAACQMRARAGETAAARLGQRVPVQSQGASQVQYENTGFNVDINSSFLKDNRIQVNLRIEYSATARAAGISDQIFFQRSFSNRASVKPNETVIMLSAVQHGTLWPKAPSQSGDAASGNFVIFLTVRVAD